jgi:tetratricopeptide (TPR) repeat protein
MIDAVHRYDGYIVQSTGDGIFALFGAPVAHEDHPQRALFAALRLQEQLNRYSNLLRGQGRLPLQARVGLNTGEVVVRSLKTQLFFAVNGLRSVYLLRAEHQKADELCEQLLRLAQSARDPKLLLLAHGGLGITSFEMGKFLPAREHLEMALSLNDPQRHRLEGLDEAVTFHLSYLAVTLSILGYRDQALRRSDQARTLAQASSNPYTLATAEFFAARLRQGRRDARPTQEIAEHLIALSAEHGFSFWLAQANIIRGGAIAQQGRYEEGMAQMREGLAALHARGPRLSYLALLAGACMEAGRLDDGFIVLSELLAAADEHRNPPSEPEAYRLRGELLLRQNESSAGDAQNCFERAIEIARTQNAKSWELRATTSLARLLAKQDHRGKARALLAAIYNWFHRGFRYSGLEGRQGFTRRTGRVADALNHS